MAGELGNLEVEIERAQNIKSGWFGRKVYVLLRYKTLERKGRTRKWNDFEWNESFNFNIGRDAQEDCIWLDVYADPHKLVGKCKISLSDVIGLRHEPMRRTYQLIADAGSSSKHSAGCGNLIILLKYAGPVIGSKVEQHVLYPPPHQPIYPDFSVGYLPGFPSTQRGPFPYPMFPNHFSQQPYFPATTDFSQVPINEIFPKPSAPSLPRSESYLYHHPDSSHRTLFQRPSTVPLAPVVSQDMRNPHPPACERVDADLEDYFAAFLPKA